MSSFALFLILLGPAVGSFLGVLVDRLPRGEPIGVQRSACRSCGTWLSLRDLVPLFSHVLLRGRCRHCGAPIPTTWFYLELAALGLGGLAVLAQGVQGAVPMTLAALWLWVLLGLAVCDMTWFRLPDPLTFALALIAAGMAALDARLAEAVLGAALGAGSFAALRLGYRWLRGREGLGLGDVKLMVGLGAWAGADQLALLVLLAAITALAVAVAGRLGRADALSPTRPLPFGAALCGAAVGLWITQV